MNDKKYLNIKEVSRRLQIEEHTIRHWDSKVAGISTRLHKNGNRFFNNENIKKIEKLKNLLYANGKKKYSLEIANTLINQNKNKHFISDKSKSDKIVNDLNEVKIKEILLKLRNISKN